MFNHKKGGATLEHILIVGAGAGGQAIVREIRQSPHLKKIVIGYLDHDPDRHHLSFQGVPVLGDTDDLKTILEKTKVDEVIIAKPALCPKELRQIVSYCQKAKVKSKILPNIGDIINDNVSIQHVREVQLEDLLNRAPVTLDVKGIERYLLDKRVLVTGAGGSIGSEICRQIAKFRPAAIVLLDNAETPLFHIENELNEKYSNINVIPSLTDIRDHRKINDVFNKYSPEVVFHAAAYKHVPMSELDIVTTVKNNVLGTSYLAEIAHKQKVKYFVMVSTDKAVNPTNAMGASKRAAEIFVQSLSRESQTNFVTVRFGNVLGSNGSVIPTFRKQIRRGGPVTVTHPDATRFFMTISEAVQLVLQAGSMGHGGEIFVLDMGEQVKILHLAEELIRLSGLVPYEDIDIAFTGLRPGEKMYEELLLDAEEVMPTSHEKIRIAKSTYCNMLQLRWKLESLYQSTIRIDQAKTLEVLTQIVPEYRQTSYSKRPLSRLPEWGGVSTQPTVLLQDKLH